MSLGTILDHPQPATACDFQDRVHVGRLAVQVHRDNAHGALGYLRLDQRRVDRVGDGIDVHEHRLGTVLAYRLASGNPSLGRHDHLVTRLHAKRMHGDVERVGAIGRGYAMLRMHQRGIFGFERLHVRAAHKAAVGDGARYRGVDLILEEQVLGMQVDKRNGHGFSEIWLVVAAQQAGRIPGIDARFGDRPGHYRPGADHYIVADRHRHDRSI